MKITRSAVQPQAILDFEKELTGIGEGITFAPVKVTAFRYDVQLALTVNKPAKCKYTQLDVRQLVQDIYKKYSGMENFIHIDTVEDVYNHLSGAWEPIFKHNIPVKAGWLLFYWRNLQGSVKVTGENLHEILEEYSDPSEGCFIFGKPNSPYTRTLPVTGTFAILKDGVLDTFYSDNNGRGLFLHLSKKISAGESAQQAVRSFFGNKFYSFEMPHE
jgi:hypothetical protein